MSLSGSILRVGSHAFEDVSRDQIVVVALGKAAASMAFGAQDAVGASRGMVVMPHDAPSPFALCVGSHPIPSESSLRCGEALLEFVADTGPSDLLVFLVSGGGSAIAVAPIADVSIEEIAEMNRRLIDSGMTITEINAARASVSRIKGGGLADAAGTRRQVSLILSDVPGSGPEHVASGPTIGGTSAPGDALFEVVGSSEIAAHAAADHLIAQGFTVSIATTNLRGESAVVARQLIDATPPGTITIAAGETTVEVSGSGVGGRNQEAALAAAIHTDRQDVLFAALGTDGIDGPTEAAGAIIDGDTAQRARESGVDLVTALRNNDSHTALTALGETLVTGPSGTNVADLWFVAKGPQPGWSARNDRMALL